MMSGIDELIEKKIKYPMNISILNFNYLVKQNLNIFFTDEIILFIGEYHVS